MRKINSLMSLVPKVVRCMEARGIGDVPQVVGGIIPREDVMKMAGMAKRVFNPKNYNLNGIISEIVDVIAEDNGINLDPEAG